MLGPRLRGSGRRSGSRREKGAPRWVSGLGLWPSRTEHLQRDRHCESPVQASRIHQRPQRHTSRKTPSTNLGKAPQCSCIAWPSKTNSWALPGGRQSRELSRRRKAQPGHLTAVLGRNLGRHVSGVRRAFVSTFQSVRRGSPRSRFQILSQGETVEEPPPNLLSSSAAALHRWRNQQSPANQPIALRRLNCEVM